MCGITPLCVSDHHSGPATKQTRERKCECEEYLADYCEKNKIERNPGDPCPHLYWHPAVLSWREQFIVAKKENERRKRATVNGNSQCNCNNGKKNGRANGKSNGKSQARQAKRRRERRANKNGILIR